MISALNGTVLSLQGNVVVLDVNGVGYEVTVTSDLRNAISGIGAKIGFVVYTDVKETSISLFGFSDQLEKQVFLLLRKVKGVGSKLALTILSSLGPVRLLASIGQDDFSSLQKVPGVGKKTAERLIVELREHVVQLATEGMDSLSLGQRIEKISIDEPKSAGLFGSVAADDAVLALEKLGFGNERAHKAVALALEGMDKKKISENPGELLRLALANL